MRSSASSSATAISPRPEAAAAAPGARSPRNGFALTGRSRPLDPRRFAVRGDLADIRLADRVFAPHYAAPSPRALASGADLRGARARDGEVLATLPAGSAFELLDVTGGVAWGIAVDAGLVGYVDAAALVQAE